MDDIAPNGSSLSLQDRDLLQRLTQYFDELDIRLRQGVGWVVFNARPPRSTRIVQYMLHRLSEPVLATHFYVPWRDFSLTSYMVEVELLSSTSQRVGLSPSRQHELDIATKVSQQTMIRMVTEDLLVIPGVSLRHGHEVRYLLATIEARYRSRLATILVTPDSPQQLENSVTMHAENGVVAWQLLSNRLYSSNLVAL
jgi:hypothetical protein